MSFYKKSKYKSQKHEIDGIKFDSKAEANYYMQLKLQEKAQRKPIIKILEIQPKVYMTDAKILYKPDFLISEDGVEIYIDVKGFRTPVFNLKARLWKYYGKGNLRLVKQVKGGTFAVDKEIITGEILCIIL